MKHIKTLGLMALAAMALTAFVGVSSASATTKFTAGKAGAKLSEKTLKNHVFTITGSKVECTEIAFEGSTEGLETTAQMVMPSYKGCTAFGFAGGQVTNEECTFNLTANGELHIEPTPPYAKCRIVVHVSVPFIAKCTISIPNQTAKGLTYSNSGASKIKVGINSTGLSATVEESTGSCPLTVGNHTTASYTGESEVSAEGTSIQVD